MRGELLTFKFDNGTIKLRRNVLISTSMRSAQPLGGGGRFFCFIQALFRAPIYKIPTKKHDDLKGLVLDIAIPLNFRARASLRPRPPVPSCAGHCANSIAYSAGPGHQSMCTNRNCINL